MTETEKLVPKRRFKEFINSSAWEQRKFADVFQPLQNNSLSRAELNYDSGSVKNIHYGDILIKFREVIDVNQAELPFISNDEFNIGNKSLIQNGDVIIADAAEDETVGKCCEIKGINNVKVVSGLHTIPCRPSKEFASGYLGYFMNSHAYHDQLLPLIQGTKISSISKSALQDTHIVFPHNQEEQSEISDYFHNLDNLITLHQRKVKKIKALKSAYLSEMFPAEGECRPKRRFAGFTEDWEQRKLLDFGKSTGGTSIESEFSEDGIYKVISIGSYSENSIYTDQGLRAVDSDKTRKRILNEGDLTMILNDKTSSGNIIGRVLLIEKSGVYVYNQRTERIEIYSEKYDSLFLYEMLNAPQIREKIIKQSQGNTQIYVNWPIIEQTEYLIPKLEEQKHIGTYFKHLDHLITLHQRKLEKLQNIKKAFLNEMFI